MAALKIISVPQKYTDVLAYQYLLDYCMRPGKTPNRYIDGFAVHPQYAAEEMQTVSAVYGQSRGIRLRHWIISFERNELPDAWHANQFAQMACRFYADTYQIVYSVHEDAAHLHIHFVMNMISYLDGKRYAGKKKDFYDYQNYLQGVAEMFGTYIIRVKDDYSSQKISPFAANDSLRPLGSR